MFNHLKVFFANKQSIAVGVAFWVLGFMFGNWATLIPTIKLKFTLDDAQLGLLLLAMPLGALMFNPVAAFLINRFGMRFTHIFGFVLIGIFYTMPLSMPTIPLTALALLFTGMGISILNVAMNTCATAIEKNEGITIMSTSHGLFSIGLMSGSILTSVALGFLVSPMYYMFGTSLFVVLLALLTRQRILSIYEEKVIKSESKDSKFVLPKGMFLMIILISICSNITEGAMADWTAVYMREVAHTGSFYIGWGLAGYSLFMATGRFLGDGIIPRFGVNRIMVVGGGIAIFGMVVALLFPFTITSIIGFSMVGAGVSCASPILYGSASRVPGMKKGGGLATLNTFGMGGFLFGPVLIGFISKAFSLPTSFGLIVLLIGVWVLLSRKTTFY